MAWSDDCVHFNVKHLEWSDDSIIIYFPRYKVEQEGVNLNDTWHIHLKPLSPEKNLVIALAKYVLNYPTLIKVDFDLFPGGFR